MILDIHLHSCYSDGIQTPEDIAKRVKALDLDGFALTDHNTVDGLKHGRESAKKLGLKFVPGMEVNCRDGHVLGMGVEETIEPTNLVEVIENIHSQGGVAIAAHPYDIFRHGVGNLIRDLKFDYIETFNARSVLPCFNRKAERISREIGIPGIAGSDAHMSSEIGLGTVEVDSIEDIYRGKMKIANKRWIGIPRFAIEKTRMTAEKARLIVNRL